jgi:hypothetical protein
MIKSQNNNVLILKIWTLNYWCSFAFCYLKFLYR